MKCQAMCVLELASELVMWVYIGLDMDMVLVVEQVVQVVDLHRYHCSVWL